MCPILKGCTESVVTGVYHDSGDGGGWSAPRYYGSQPNSPYVTISFSRNGRVTTKHLHRLLAQVFIPNPENKPYVNHKDGNKKNNDLTNLEWCTAQENHKHALENNLVVYPRGNSHHYTKVSDGVVMDAIHRINRGESVRDLANEVGISRSQLNLIKRGKSRRHLNILDKIK